MEYITSFIYCDSIQTEVTPQGAKPQIINPLQVLAPIAIPGNYSFCIACNVSGFDEHKENEVQLIFVSPKGKTIYDTGKINFQIPEEQVSKNKPGTVQFNLDLRNVVLEEQGICTTKVIMNGNTIGEYKIAVVLGELK